MSRRGGGRDRRAVGVEPGHGSPGLPLGHPALAPQGPPSPLSQPGVGGGGAESNPLSSRGGRGRLWAGVVVQAGEGDTGVPGEQASHGP